MPVDRRQLAYRLKQEAHNFENPKFGSPAIIRNEPVPPPTLVPTYAGDHQYSESGGYTLVDDVATPQSNYHYPVNINIDWVDPPHQIQNRRPLQSIPAQIVEEPRGWHSYLPAAAALGALGLGTGYALAPKGMSPEEEEQIKQQMMQQQMYIQQLQAQPKRR